MGDHFDIVYQWQSTVSLIALSPDLSPFYSIEFLFDIGLLFLVFSFLCPRANQGKVRRKARRKSSFREQYTNGLIAYEVKAIVPTQGHTTNINALYLSRLLTMA